MNALFSIFFTYTPLRYFVQSFWRDEAFTYLLARKNIVELLLITARDANPPLYYLLLHFWMVFFGSSELAIRMVSFIFFLATLYMAGLCLMEFFKTNSRWTFAYLLLFALNPLLHYYAFEGRMYSMFAFFSLLSFYFLYKKNYRNYLIAAILGLYTHYFMVFVLLSQAVYMLIQEKGLTRKLLRLYAAIAGMFAPWLLIVLISHPPVAKEFWVVKPTLETILDLPGRVFTGYEELLGYTYLLLPLISVFFYLFFLAAGYRLFRSKRKLSLRHIRHDPFLTMLLSWVFIPLLLIVGVSLFKPIFLPRYTIFITIGFLFLFIRLLQSFDMKIRLALLAVAFVFTIHYGFFQAAFRIKGDVRKTLTEIKKVMGKEDVVYVTDPYDFHPAQYYINDKAVYIYGRSYDSLPWFIGKVLIPEDKIAGSLPTYPKKAFIMTGDNSYVVQALY